MKHNLMDLQLQEDIDTIGNKDGITAKVTDSVIKYSINLINRVIHNVDNIVYINFIDNYTGATESITILKITNNLANLILGSNCFEITEYHSVYSILKKYLGFKAS